MAKCRVCRRESNQTICPHCGYQRVVPIVQNEEIERKLNELADDYRKDLLGDLKIYVKTYAYELTSEGLNFKEERKLSLVNTDDFSRDRDIWNDQIFGTTEDLDLTLYVEMKDVDGTIDLSLPAPKKLSEWYIGINLSEDLNIRVMVGNRENYSISESLDLLRINRGE